MSTQVEVNPGYSIMEAARISGLPESTLRYYESVGIISPVKRDSSSKHRVYSEDDINIIVSIACLNATGMSLNNMREYIKNNQKGASAAQKQINLLEDQGRRLKREAVFLSMRQRYVETKIEYWQARALGDDQVACNVSERAREIAQELKVSA